MSEWMLKSFRWKKVLIYNAWKPDFYSKCPIFNLNCKLQMCTCVYVYVVLYQFEQDNQETHHIDGWAFVIVLYYSRCVHMWAYVCVCVCLFINCSHHLHVNRFAILFITCFAYRYIHRLYCDRQKSIVKDITVVIIMTMMMMNERTYEHWTQQWKWHIHAHTTKYTRERKRER